MLYPIFDLHCDLLSYLEDDSERTAYDLDALCSIPQLMQGHVRYQILAAFTRTGLDSVKKGMAQIGIFEQLPLLYPEHFIHFDKNMRNASHTSNVAIALACENASTFCSEDESLELGLNRLQGIIDTIYKPLYISLTWNMENRFGGGALTNIGLKEDGKRLLDFLHDKNIAIDFSHASDALAYDLFTYMDKHHLNLTVMASHSNARVITQALRNLPDDIAKEIFRRKGVIGMNFYRPFVGETSDVFMKHLSHWIDLGGSSHICFGADFFYEQDKKTDNFFPDYDNASCYPKFLSACIAALHLDEQTIENLCYRNFMTFLEAHA